MEYVKCLACGNCSINICSFSSSQEAILYNRHKARLWDQEDSADSCMNLSKKQGSKTIYSSQGWTQQPQKAAVSMT